MEDSSVTSELGSFRIRLLCRVRIGKSRDCHAGVIDARDTWILVEREVKCHGRRYLCDQADIRDGWLVAVANDPARGMFGEPRLNRLPARAAPMLAPAKPLLVADL